MARKLLVLLLALVLASSFGACSSAPASATSTPPATATVEPTTALTPTPTQGPAIVLEVFSMVANTSGLQENWWANYIKDRINIQIDLQPAGDQSEQKLQAMMASGELPDIVVFQTAKQVVDAVRGSMLLCLDDHLDQLPNVQANAATALQFYRDTASADTGKAYAVPNLIGSAEVSNDGLNWSPQLRWDLYKKLEMPELKTLEDYLPLLKQMQDMYPETADGQKVYAFSLFKDWDGIQMFLAATMSEFVGIDTGDQLGNSLPFLQVDLSTGETMSILDPNSQYIRNLKFYFQANQMGLVDPDSMTQRFDTVLDKAGSGRVLFGWWSWLTGGFNTTENTNADEPVGFCPVFTSDYKGLMAGDSAIGSAWAWAIGAKTKYPDQCLEYLDFMYTIDDLVILMNGPKGVTWDLDADGNPYYTDVGWDCIENQTPLADGGKIGDGVNIINFQPLTGTTISPALNTAIKGGYWESTKGRNPTKLWLDYQDITGYKTVRDMLEDKNMYVKTPLATKLIPTIPDDIQTLAKQIGNIVQTNSWKMVFAKDQAEFDSLLQDMTDQANGMGIDQVLTYDKQAWQTAQENAAKYNQ